MVDAVEPDEHGLLDVGDGNHVYWEAVGDPHRPPLLVVHGGPGSGCSPGQRRNLAGRRYRAILFDQRGCGRSTPHASDPRTDMSVNTTAHLLADMERLREHLGVERWVLFGGSWGSTLILAYAERHPERVVAVVIPDVTMSRRREIDWLYRGVGMFLPQEWERFRDHVPVADRGDHLAGYRRLVDDPDDAVRAAATDAWLTWEDAVIAHESNGRPGAYGDRPERARRALVRICAHYFSQGMFLGDGVLLRDAHRLAGIPAVLVHGRLDLGGPLVNAWELARAWPDAELVVIDDAGHTGSAAFGEALDAALTRFATT